MCNFFRLPLSDSWCYVPAYTWHGSSHPMSVLQKLILNLTNPAVRHKKNIFLNLIAISPCFLSWWMAKSIKMIYYNIGIWNNMKNLITLLKTTGAYLRAQTIETSSLPTIPRGPSSSKSNVIMMTFLLFAPASTKWLGWRKDRKSRRDRSGRFCDIYWAVILRYSFALRSDILWSSCFESHGPKDTR